MIVLANYGTWAVDSVSRPSEDTMMRCLMPASIALATSWPLLLLTVSREYIMCSLVLAYLSCKVTKMRSPRSLSTPRATKLLLQAVTRLAAYGLWIQVMSTRFSRATRMKSSPVLLTTKVIQSLQVQRITLAAFGKINMHSRA